METDISAIKNFLGCDTPASWCEVAAAKLDILLIDHAHCEKKAASSAIVILFRYPEYEDLIFALSRIAREELRHFEQVIRILKKRNIPFRHLPPSRYADELRKGIATHEPSRLIDILIITAFIEARSCERFAAIIPYLDEELGRFYSQLLASEARHFQTYLNFAFQYATTDITNRIQYFREKEKNLILTSDDQLRFHSGISC